MTYHSSPRSSSNRILLLTSTTTIPARPLCAALLRLPSSSSSSSFRLLRRYSIHRPISESNDVPHIDLRQLLPHMIETLANSTAADPHLHTRQQAAATERTNSHPDDDDNIGIEGNATPPSYVVDDAHGGMNPILLGLLTSRGRPASGGRDGDQGARGGGWNKVVDGSRVAAAAIVGQHSCWEYGVACNDCGKSFRSADSLHQHQWDSAHHTRVALRRPSTSNFSLALWPWTCSHCAAIFPTAYHLEAHFSSVHPLIELAESDEEWLRVAGRFLTSWKKSEELPDVRRIFKVYNAGWRRQKYEERRRELKRHYANKKRVKLDYDEEVSGLRALILNDGNERSVFHGTTVACSRGRFIGSPPPPVTNGAPVLCDLPLCNLCCILRYGFRREMCRKHRFQRFGTGIYTSSISGKANDYVRCYDDVGSNPVDPGRDKVMLLCKVLAGRPFPSTRNLASLRAPPSGFDSVHGQPGVALNYDELVLYDNRAILPAYVVHYACTSQFAAK